MLMAEVTAIEEEEEEEKNWHLYRNRLHLK
jgi:hypothetical protein